MKEFKYKEITEKIIRALMKVHSAIGNGFQELIYQRALALQLEADGLKYQREANMPIYYLDTPLSQKIYSISQNPSSDK